MIWTFFVVTIRGVGHRPSGDLSGTFDSLLVLLQKHEEQDRVGTLAGGTRAGSLRHG